MKVFFLLLISFASYAMAQSPSQPEKESVDDLRTGLIMFSIDNENEGSRVWLERTSSDDYFLRMKEGKQEKILKLSSKEAKQIDMEFASKFLKSMYELPATPEKCKKAFHLVMKGEGQNICKEEELKTQEFKPFDLALRKRF